MTAYGPLLLLNPKKMEVPKQITEFAKRVDDGAKEIGKLVSEYNRLKTLRDAVSEISGPYLKFQPINDPEEARELLFGGIDAKLDRLAREIQEKVDEVYSTECAFPDRVR